MLIVNKSCIDLLEGGLGTTDVNITLTLQSYTWLNHIITWQIP